MSSRRQPEDLVAASDQAKEAAKTTAGILAAFYLQLIAAEVDQTTARYLTQEYQRNLQDRA